METLVEVNKKDANNAVVFEFKGELDETNADKTFKNIIQGFCIVILISQILSKKYFCIISRKLLR